MWVSMLVGGSVHVQLSGRRLRCLSQPYYDFSYWCLVRNEEI